MVFQIKKIFSEPYNIKIMSFGNKYPYANKVSCKSKIPRYFKYRGYVCTINIAQFFSHPDFTVGSGISPDQLPNRLAGRGLYRRLGITPDPEEFPFKLYPYIPISFFCTDTLHPYKLFSGNKKTRRISPFSSGLLYKLILASANKQRF